MRHFQTILWSSLVCLSLASCQSRKTSEEAPWIPLFNGVDLKGWTPKFSGYPVGDNYKNTFIVRDSAIVVSYAGYDTFRNDFGHLYTDSIYEAYRLKLEYRFVGDPTPGAPGWAIRNNGVMLHAQSPRSMELHQGFPVSIEVQLLGGNGQDLRPTGNLCTPGTHVMVADTLSTEHCLYSSSQTYHGDQWVALEVAVLPDGNIYHLINGDTVMRYSNPVIGGDHLPASFQRQTGEPLHSGHLAIQAESHQTEFKNIRLQKIQ